MTIKCAIYTRKSTEHGLEQEFNSLQNQEESCKAYIASQSFNGWQYYKTYSDAAISGGTMERPALKQMLDDMAHGLVNTVVVYKVDRLSRSILDFHNMMKYFEKYGANFVSITQSFDTSTSMGKLTLNMLLSFAQFEREVSSERVRDKIRASKAKGLWMGGAPRLGYDLINKKLVVNPTEAEQVRHLFEKYLELQSVNDLTEYARQNGIYGKRWETNKRKIRGGNPIAKMSMHRILRDKIYIGQIENKKEGTFAKGEHEPIISENLFNRVQVALANNANNKSQSTHAPNILTGKLFNHNGVKFINQRTSGKGKRKIHYYATKGFYLTAACVDEIVVKTITQFLNSDMSNVYSQEQLIYSITTDMQKLQPFIKENYINANAEPMEYIIGDNSVTITEKVFLRKYVNTVYDRGKKGVLSVTDNHHLILKAFATAWKYRELYEREGNVDNIIRNLHTSPRQFYRHLDIAYMNPSTVNQILSGKLKISVNDLYKIAKTTQL